MTEFFSDIPLWSLILWGVFTLLISIYYYRPKKWLTEISTVKRWVLSILRFLGLFILGVLLIGILIKSTISETDRPTLITIIDNSKSMLNYSDSSTVKKSSEQYLKQLESSFDNQFNILSFTLDDIVKNIDLLHFDNKKSNLSEAVDRVYNNYYGRNIGAIILLSDGNYNRGSNPSFIAEKFKNIPFYTLAVGDTIQKKDHLISNVVGNEIAFLNNKFPIEFTIEGNLANNENFDLTLFDNGKKIASKSLKHGDTDYSIQKFTFNVDAKSTGVHHYTANIQSLYNESNFKNNEKSIYVEVLDDRSNVLLVSEGLHPDVGAIKSALDKEQNIEVTSKLMKDLPDNLSKYDLIVWHNPGISRNKDSFEQLLRLDKPIWYIIGSATNQSTVQALKIASNVQTNGQSDKVGIKYNELFKLFELSKETKSNFSIFPPLNINYGNIQVNNASNIMGYQTVGAITKKDPLYFFGKRGEIKYGVTYGTGIWGWKLADYQKNGNTNAFNEIISKTIQYLIVKENTSRLRIKLPKLINEDENVIVKASFYNESLEPINNPEIIFELTNQNDEQIDYSFLPENKNYSLDLGRLEAGEYDWIARCEYNGETFQKEGSFVVKKLELESLNTKANHTLLNQIAKNNGAEFYILSNYPHLIKDLDARDDIVSVSYESSSYKKLIDYLWWFVILVSLFSMEWFLRRYNGGY